MDLSSVRPGGVLCLDLASTVGFAVGHLGDAAPRFGCWRLPSTGGEGGRYVAFENILAETMDAVVPSAVVLEASLTLQALASASTIVVARQQLTLRGIAYMESYRASVPISEVSADIVRLVILGQSRFAKGTVKQEVVRYCRDLGLMVPDHNAGDAVLTWLWYKGQVAHDLPCAGPLFRPGRLTREELY